MASLFDAIKDTKTKLKGKAPAEMQVSTYQTRGKRTRTATDAFRELQGQNITALPRPSTLLPELDTRESLTESMTRRTGPQTEAEISQIKSPTDSMKKNN